MANPPQPHIRNEQDPEAGYGLLDYSAFPHIVELVVKFTDRSTSLALRQTCKSLHTLTDNEHFWKKPITVEVDTYWDMARPCPQTGIVDLFSVFPNPAMCAMQEDERGGYGNVSVEEYNTACLRAIFKAKVIDLQARCDMAYDECSDLSQDATDMVTKALTTLRRCRDCDIPVLRVEEFLPTPVIEGGVHTVIKFEWAYRNRPVQASLNIPNVARAVLHVAFDKYYFNLGFERLESPPTTVLERRPTAPCVNSAVPHLVVIFSDFISLPWGFWHNYWDNLKLGWLDHLFQTIIYDCHRTVTIVGALTLHPVLLGVSDTFASSEHYLDAIVETASSMAEEWRDGSLECHPGWTQALAKAAIGNITFLTHEEYRQLIGDEQYTMETVSW